MIILIFFIAHWYLSLFTQTFFQHRYAAHGAFTMRKGWEKFFYVFTFITQGSSFMSAKAYAIMHRMHHAFTDTEKDPHSPKFSPNVFSMMWSTRKIYNDILHERTEIEPRFTKQLPEWKALENFGHHRITRVMWSLGYIAFYIIFASSPWLYLLLPLHFVMGPLHGAIINWYAHKYGRINFKMKNTSKNLFAYDVLMMGEGLHNNHHKFPSHINFATGWKEFDPTYPFILLLKYLRIIKVNKTVAVQQEF